MGSLLSSLTCNHESSVATKGSITDVDRAILSLKTQRTKLQAQQKLLEVRIDRHVEVASQLLREKKKDRALLALKKKKLTMKQHEQLMGLLLNVEDTLSNIETTKQHAKLFTVLQQGNDALKKLQQQVTVEDAQKIMDDTAEAKAYQDELQAVLGESLTDADDAEVAAELDILETEAMAAEMEGLPKVPATKAPAAVATAAAAAGTKAAEAVRSEEEIELEIEGQGRQKEAMLAS